jgi:hypothetical protein
VPSREVAAEEYGFRIGRRETAALKNRDRMIA